MTEDQQHRYGAEQWDGTEPYELAWAAAFPLKDHEWSGLRGILDLPEASRRDFDVLISVFRAFIDERGYDLPPGKTVRQLSAFAKKLSSFRGDFTKIAMNGVVSNRVAIDGEFWFMVTTNVEIAAKKLKEYEKYISDERAKTGQNWSHLYLFADITENILNRHGLSLAVMDGIKERRDRNGLFLRKLFMLATCKLKPSTSAKIIQLITSYQRDRGRDRSKNSRG